MIYNIKASPQAPGKASYRCRESSSGKKPWKGSCLGHHNVLDKTDIGWKQHDLAHHIRLEGTTRLQVFISSISDLHQFWISQLRKRVARPLRDLEAWLSIEELECVSEQRQPWRRWHSVEIILASHVQPFHCKVSQASIQDIDPHFSFQKECLRGTTAELSNRHSGPKSIQASTVLSQDADSFSV